MLHRNYVEVMTNNEIALHLKIKEYHGFIDMIQSVY